MDKKIGKTYATEKLRKKMEKEKMIKLGRRFGNTNKVLNVVFNEVVKKMKEEKTDNADWKCLICGEDIEEGKMCKCMRDSKNGM